MMHDPSRGSIPVDEENQHVPSGSQQRTNVAGVIFRSLILKSARTSPGVPAIDVEPIPRKSEYMQQSALRGMAQSDLFREDRVEVDYGIVGQYG
jgi:hypothetical protein